MIADDIVDGSVPMTPVSQLDDGQRGELANLAMFLEQEGFTQEAMDLEDYLEGR